MPSIVTTWQWKAVMLTCQMWFWFLYGVKHQFPSIEHWATLNVTSNTLNQIAYTCLQLLVLHSSSAGNKGSRHAERIAINTEINLAACRMLSALSSQLAIGLSNKIWVVSSLLEWLKHFETNDWLNRLILERCQLGCQGHWNCDAQVCCMP